MENKNLSPSGVNSTEAPTPQLKKSKIMTVLGALVLVLVVVTALVVFIQSNSSNLALKVGNIDVSKTAYNSLIAQAAEQKITKSVATNDIINYEKQFVASKSLNVFVPSELLNSSYFVANPNANTSNVNNLNSWQKLSGEALAIDTAVVQLQKGAYDGTVYEFPFDMYFSNGIPPSTNPKFGNAAAITADNAYALQQANSYRSELIKNSISEASALSQIIANPQLQSVGSSNQSSAFFFDKSGDQYTDGNAAYRSYPSSVVSATEKLKDNQFSSIGTQQEYVTITTVAVDKDQEVNSQYYFIKLNKYYAPNPQLQTQFNKVVQSTKVTNYE